MFPLKLMRNNGREKTSSISSTSSKILIRKTNQGKCLKILTPKKMFQKLTLALAQEKARNTSENLLDEICQIIYFWYRATKITKKTI